MAEATLEWLADRNGKRRTDASGREPRGDGVGPGVVFIVRTLRNGNGD